MIFFKTSYIVLKLMRIENTVKVVINYNDHLKSQTLVKTFHKKQQKKTGF